MYSTLCFDNTFNGHQKMMILWYNAEVISNPLTVLKSLIKTFFYKWFYWEMDLLLIIIRGGFNRVVIHLTGSSDE